MRKLKSGSPFRQGAQPHPRTKRGRTPKTAKAKYSLAPANLRRTRKWFEERGAAYHAFGGERPSKFLHSSRNLAVIDEASPVTRETYNYAGSRTGRLR